MMTSRQIRQSFLGLFKSKQHTIVPSLNLTPDLPIFLFAKKGMNWFAPVFLLQLWLFAGDFSRTSPSDQPSADRCGQYRL
ncbi:MAG: alanine--tRNA ligase-related protein [Verrucomicrobiales bacterium]|nr:alanine--tRNA ligase-related protein [Verrucomicrobiales bacterium]